MLENSYFIYIFSAYGLCFTLLLGLWLYIGKTHRTIKKLYDAKTQKDL